MAISADGNDVYVAGAVSNALLTFSRNPSTGALAQATDGTGSMVQTALSGCTTGTQLDGANAVAISPDDGDVYVTSLISNSLTSFTRATDTGVLTQQSGTSACAIYVYAVGCSLGRALSAPEGLAVAPDGANVYVTAFESNAVDVFNRNTTSGALIQKSGRGGCLTSSNMPDCRKARSVSEVSSAVVSPDGRYVYTTGFASNAIAIFKRLKG
jgi:DNA-binding beta-propeller fold protein YncE